MSLCLDHIYALPIKKDDRRLINNLSKIPNILAYIGGMF
jgi:hypothetical protein